MHPWVTRMLDFFTAARTVTVMRRIFIARDAAVVGRFLADVENLPRFEPKLESVKIIEGREGMPKRMRARARIATFTRDFEIDYAPHARGFKSATCDIRFAKFSGGFFVRKVGGGCVVSHVERYEFKSLLIAHTAGRIWRWYANRSIDREVAELKKILERQDPI